MKFFFWIGNKCNIIKNKKGKKISGCSHGETTKDNRKHRNQESILMEEINTMIEEQSERPQHLDQ